MITVYLIDEQRIFSGSCDLDPLGSIPANARLTPPPELFGTQVAQWHDGEWAAQAEGEVVWRDGGWVVLPESPIVPAQHAPVPQSVTMRQARLALLQSGLLAKVDVAIDALPSPQKEAARIEWDYSSEVWRSKPFVQQLGVALGLDEAALDALFITAAAL